MLTLHIAVIGGVDDQRVVVELVGPERVQNLSDQRVGPVYKTGIGSPRPQGLGVVEFFYSGKTTPPAQ